MSGKVIVKVKGGLIVAENSENAPSLRAVASAALETANAAAMGAQQVAQKMVKQQDQHGPKNTTEVLSAAMRAADEALALAEKAQRILDPSSPRSGHSAD
jgi:hypothetical protein